MGGKSTGSGVDTVSSGRGLLFLTTFLTKYAYNSFSKFQTMIDILGKNTTYLFENTIVHDHLSIPEGHHVWVRNQLHRWPLSILAFTLLKLQKDILFQNLSNINLK